MFFENLGIGGLVCGGQRLRFDAKTRKKACRTPQFYYKISAVAIRQRGI
jgi:hypothetical protein